MARGWESKAAEDQQAEQQAEVFSRRKPRVPPPTPQESERESLLLQRKRIEALIAASENPRYIEQQKKALAFLDEKLRAFDV